MPNLTTKNFNLLVQEWAAVVQGSIAAAGSKVVLSFDKGTIFLALAEAQASASLWLQGLILRLLTATRLSTSKGLDADTWTADYMPGAVGGAILPNGQVSPRLVGNAATGLVTFSRNVPTNPAVVPVGAQVQSGDGVQNFAVTADPTNGAYGAAVANGLPGYTIPAAVLSLDVPVQFQFPAGYVPGTYAGPVGNVQIGGITILKTGISGVDSVSNAAAFTNGFLAETDVALRARFPLFIASLAKGTEGAIGYAVVSVQQGLEYQIWEPGIGVFTTLTVFVDDGSGAIPAGVLASVTAAIFGTKAAGVQVAVFGASLLTANVTMTIQTAPGYYHPTVVAQVVAALGLYINGIGLGDTVADGTLSYMRLSQVAFDASPGVTDVTGYILNGSTSDLVPAAGQTIKSGTIIVS